MSTFSLAPAAVARIGSMPLATLESLSSPALARHAAEADAQAFAAEYERVLEEHRHHLWRHTVANPRVRCGLALASPSLAAELGDPTPSPRRNKRARHLDTSLYRYLARAVGRLEPCGLWTSVTLASLGDAAETTVTPCPPKTHVAPELAPLRELVRALAQREPYRSQGPYRLDPTLQIDAEGRWCHAQRHPDGRLTWTTLPASGAWPLLVARCGDGRPRSLDELRQALVPAVSTSVAEALLGFALEAGLVVGGLQFPARFGTPWEALALVQASLSPAHREPWAAACGQLVRACAEVEVALDAALVAPAPSTGSQHAATVLAGHQRVRAVIEALAAALAVPCPRLPATLLRCDETAPFRITLGQPDRQRVEALLRRWSRLERRHGSHRRWARRSRRVAASCPQGRLTAAPRPDDALPEESAEPSAREPAGPPMGALVLRPGAEGLAAPWVRGLSHAPTVTHARHAYHLAERGDSLLPWFRAAYRDLARRDGVEVVDLVCSTAGSPNVQARPRYVEPTLDPWGAAAEGPGVDALRVVQGPTPGALLLAHGGRRLAAHVFTPLVIPSSDVITHRLMTTSFDDRSNEPTAEPNPPAELETDHDEPDAALPRPRRTRLSPAEAERLLAVRGAARFVRWQELVRHHGWPRWVRVLCGTRPGLLVPTDGPLPLEAVFEGAGTGDRLPEIVVEAVLDGAWLPGPTGHHFVELVLPVRRRRSAWTRPTVHPEPLVESDHGRL